MQALSEEVYCSDLIVREFLGMVDVEPSMVVGGKGWFGVCVQRWMG